VKKVTLKEVKERIKGLDDKTAKHIVCALVGHSKIQNFCFGYYTCARCGAQVGDNLGSIYPGADTAVVVGHNCSICRKNFKKCTWKDTFLSPTPFEEKKEAKREEGS
jgi:ribosomal protein L37AE/L43A